MSPIDKVDLLFRMLNESNVFVSGIWSVELKNLPEIYRQDFISIVQEWMNVDNDPRT